MSHTLPESIRKKIQDEAEAIYPFTEPSGPLFTINELKQLARDGYTAAAEQILSHPEDYGLSGIWVQGSDRVPEHQQYRFIKIDGVKAIGKWSFNHKVFINEVGDFFYKERVEWLDESPTPSSRVAQLEQALREIVKWKFATEVNGNHKRILKKVVGLAEATLSEYYMQTKQS
jgi:hypothetical protein